MRQHIIGSSCAVLLIVAAAHAGQIPNRPPSQAPVTKGSGATGQQAPAPTAGRVERVPQVTVVGCVERESTATGAAGGVLNSGAGAGNEFVLEKATDKASEKPAAVGTTGVAPPSAITTGTSYSLTGDREHELADLVGQRVEIVGTIEGTRGAMRELAVASFKATGRCQGERERDSSPTPGAAAGPWRPPHAASWRAASAARGFRSAGRVPA
jgi:hypothetical protein